MCKKRRDLNTWSHSKSNLLKRKTTLQIKENKHTAQTAKQKAETHNEAP